MDYIVHLLILIGIYLILAQSFNLNFGLGGLFNLAHVATYAIGAYTTALLSTDLQVGVWQCLIASGLHASFLAFLIGAISLRLTQDYFAIGSLAFSSVVGALLINWKSLTRGVLGIPGIPRPEIGTIDFYNIVNYFVFVAIICLVSQVCLWILFRSSYARSLRAQAEADFSAMTLNRNTRAIKSWSFLLSSFFAGISGSLFAFYLNYIDPSSFSLTEMIFVLTIVVIGRPGSFWGVIASTIFLVLLPEPLRFLEIPPSILGPMRQMLYALILFAMVYINRAKLFPVQRTV
ncbi:MAG: branched-chain amino acid ABC transporter permease [Proteobacteria bacterium]|nr:MAG: branched-chain amino acid ABC transporter permease [Pseudomonadota bacterium]